MPPRTHRALAEEIRRGRARQELGHRLVRRSVREQKPAGDAKRADRDLRNRTCRVGGPRRPLDGIGGREVEAGQIAVLRFLHPRVDLHPEAGVDRQLRADAPVVLHEQGVIALAEPALRRHLELARLRARRRDRPGRRGRQPEEELRPYLPRVVQARAVARASVEPVELKAAARVAAADDLPPLIPELVARAGRVSAANRRHRRLHGEGVHRPLEPLAPVGALRAERRDGRVRVGRAEAPKVKSGRYS